MKQRLATFLRALAERLSPARARPDGGVRWDDLRAELAAAGDHLDKAGALMRAEDAGPSRDVGRELAQLAAMTFDLRQQVELLRMRAEHDAATAGA